MSTSALLLLVSLLVCTYAQKKPTWPPAGSSSLFITGFGERRDERHFLRYFYNQEFERFDGPRDFFGEQYWTTAIHDVRAKQEWFIAYQRDLVDCETFPNNRTLPHPNFNNARFVGKSLIDYIPVDHWIERNGERDVASIFSREDNQEIVRIDLHHSTPRNPRPHVVEIKFIEFDAGSQDPSLFVVPAAIKQVCNERKLNLDKVSGNAVRKALTQ